MVERASVEPLNRDLNFLPMMPRTLKDRGIIAFQTNAQTNPLRSGVEK